ncbi:MAG TPA: hypothetical protein VHU44_07265 [Acidobacteriaceae bacterium]|jgi:hypothetical protein|nr:hypothetical protein [Acidobacteriaceae bacterium]
MHIEYRINEADYRSAAELAMRRRSNLSSLDYFLPYIFSIVWVAAALITGAADDGFSDSSDLIFVFGAVPVLIGLLWRRRKVFGADFLRMSVLHPLQILNLDTTAITRGIGKEAIKTPWSFYTKFAENQKVFILYQEGSHHFLPIVKSHLTVLQVDELRSLLLARLPH